MAVQTTAFTLACTASNETSDRQCRAVVDYLMKAAFGDPQVHYRVHASPVFQAGFRALDPDLPGFVADEATRSIIMVGCLHIIDETAALLRFARENNIQIVPQIPKATRDGESDQVAG